MKTDFISLIKEFDKIKFSNPKEKEITYFDVAGFPHYENVASNILQFFLDTNNDGLHGLGNLWLRAFINAYNQKADDKIPDADYYTNDVKREYSNGSDKRIDLLVDVDSFLLVIENKIYADVYNDLNLYTQMAKNYKNPPLGIKGIVLSLSPINDKDHALSQANYINITYDELFDYLIANWTDIDVTNKWQLFALEFIENIKQLKGIINMKFDQDWLKFVNENGESLNKLFKLYRNDLEMRLCLLKELDKALMDQKGIIRHGVYNSSSETYISEYIDVVKDNNTVICIETYLMKQFSEKDWERFNTLYVCVWARRNKNYDFTNVLNKLNSVSAKKENTEGWGKHYILKEMVLNENFDLQELKDSVLAYVNALLN